MTEQKKNPHAVLLGRKGGKSRSPKKLQAVRENMRRINERRKLAKLGNIK